MDTLLIILDLIVLPIAAVVAVLTLPRWFPRRLSQDRIWRLRDRLVDDVTIHGRLPGNHPAVVQLVREMDKTLRTTKHVTLLDFWLTDRFVLRRLDKKTLDMIRRRAEPCPLTGLDRAQRARVKEYRDAYRTYWIGSLILGSWFGLFFVFRRLLKVTYRRWTRQRVGVRRLGHMRVGEAGRRLELGVREGALEATDQAANNSKLGQRIGKMTPLLKALPSWRPSYEEPSSLAA